MLKLSMGAWSFAFGPYAENPKPVDEIARKLAAAGYDGIELSGWPPHVTLERYPTRASRLALAQFLSDLGLGVSGYSADLSAANPLLPENRGAYLEQFRALLEVCSDLGSPTIRVDTVSAPGSIPDNDYHTAFYRLADLWRECADYARSAQVSMVWEFEPGFIFNKPSEVVEMHQRVGHPWFQILFDTAHAYLGAVTGARQHGRKETLEGGVVEYLDLLHGAVGAVHIVDTDGTLYADETSTHLSLGQGHVPWKWIMPKLVQVPHLHWMCLDLCFCPDAWELVDENLRLARGLLKDAGG